MKSSDAMIIGIILFTFIAGLAIYDHLPAEMASHWDAAGNVNGTLPRVWGVLLIPCILVLLFVTFKVFIPKNTGFGEQAQKNLANFIVLVCIFLAYAHGITLLWNLGIYLEIIRWLAPGLGVILYAAGILCENLPRNFFAGIRTPWTLMSDEVWVKTHITGSLLFKLAGTIALLGAFFPKQAYLFILVPIIGIVIWAVVFSYWEYKKLPPRKKFVIQK